MKFAKKLSAELYPEWGTQYLDYKQMKKILKREEDPEVVQSFCSVLESEIAKIHRFMRSQQELLTKDIDPLELWISGDTTCGTPAVGGYCQALVYDLQKFRNYTFLNQLGCRKIIKKFSKRFNCRIDETLQVPIPAEQFITESDIDFMLLTPAMNCLRLMMTVNGDVERPLKQFKFWVGELKAGCHLAQCRVSGDFDDKSGSPLILRQNQDKQICVKNTFLTTFVERCEFPARRTRSQPPRLRLTDDDSNGSEDCTTPSAEMQPEAVDDSASDQEELETPRVSAETMACHSLQSRLRGSFHGSASPPSAKNATRTANQSKHTEAGSAQTAFSSARWWVEVSEVCPLSGFPIALLPYPPYKFQLGVSAGSAGKSKEAVKLVDGPFLVLQVLSTWHFEVLGRQLTGTDITSLDKYMKRCKLGPFRLGKAMKLFSDFTPQAKHELEVLRQRAGRKLEGLKHIQRVRVARSQPGADQAGTATSRPAAATPSSRKMPNFGAGFHKPGRAEAKRAPGQADRERWFNAKRSDRDTHEPCLNGSFGSESTVMA
mmetsp:Transcript_66127/g.121975  ORF Transcript_66127/g.121975 Transcript_66127/m.121975 type:complete len:545 (+) Transcript_66127:66-1700(+)